MKKLFLIVLLITTYSATSQNLHLYGGSDYTEYLGCLDCSRFDSKSIWNAFGDYGSSFSNTSIWNDLNNYGDPNKKLSPWNEVTNTPPKILDDKGKFKGYLTANTSLKDRSLSRLATELVKNYKVIPKDIGKWYKKLITDYSKL
ncbi:hypothetical protein A9Q93_03875 [Nonlabens dokdonensis]|uniref:Glycyl-tRNA synthetase subunit alpha n=1 Tax=Nonlabens dokdonensis TaxID=328515 RepID=A0A1Z8B7P9_9FLAO|nr:hypothetical protein [Nonlabens dokdonensis]OUS18518.1 hypothetical protein A9Q93_03875 [Nonlabens dokdonensis]